MSGSRDIWDRSKPWRDPLSGRVLTRPVGQRVTVKAYPYNGVILGVGEGPERGKNGRRLPHRPRLYKVEHDDGEVFFWPWHAVKTEGWLEALAKMAAP